MWFDNLPTSTKLQGIHYYQEFPPLHGLSFSKSPIKNHAILFESGWVVKPNQIKLGSTKPNSKPITILIKHIIRLLHVLLLIMLVHYRLLQTSEFIVIHTTNFANINLFNHLSN